MFILNQVLKVFTAEVKKKIQIIGTKNPNIDFAYDCTDYTHSVHIRAIITLRFRYIVPTIIIAIISKYIQRPKCDKRKARKICFYCSYFYCS